MNFCLSPPILNKNHHSFMPYPLPQSIGCLCFRPQCNFCFDRRHDIYPIPMHQNHVNPFLQSEPAFCIVLCLRTYLPCSVIFRPLGSLQLLLSYICLPCSVHSIWVAAAYLALSIRDSQTEILRSADWSPESTFWTFYFKPLSHAAHCLHPQH